MKLTLGEPRLLKESVNIISELVNEVTLKVDRDKIEIVAIDPASVAMVEFKLLSSAFVEYSVPAPQELAINLDHLKQVLKRAKATDTITFTLDNEKNRLQILLKGGAKKTFNIPLITIDESEQVLPNLDYQSKITLPSAKFDEVVEDMDIISESMAMHVQPERFLVRAESSLKDAQVEMPSTDEVIIILDGDAMQSKYSIEYLKKISKASKLADTVSLEIGEDYPLRVEYKLLDKLRLSFILAPRVSN
jgi:proliferating cell nuclear antigen